MKHLTRYSNLIALRFLPGCFLALGLGAFAAPVTAQQSFLNTGFSISTSQGSTGISFQQSTATAGATAGDPQIQNNVRILPEATPAGQLQIIDPNQPFEILSTTASEATVQQVRSTQFSAFGSFGSSVFQIPP